MIRLEVCFQLLVLLTLANGVPVILRRVLGDRFSWPLDGGLVLHDGAPLFGRSKTIRGVVGAVLVTAVGAVAMGLAWWIGALFGLAAMAGDLASSFTKRRLKLPASSQAMWLDQIPEALLPLLVCLVPMGLTWLEVMVVVGLFSLGEMIVSPILWRLRIREKPY